MTPELVGVSDIEAAAARIAGAAVRTPLIPVTGTDPPLWLKPESLQPTGAFKLRGAYAAISLLPAQRRAAGVVAHSSGNHAQAVAYAARLLGAPATIVVPETAAAVKTAATSAYGARLVRVPATLAARVAATEELARTHGYEVIPPFDDPRVIAGQGTIGLELAADLAAGAAGAEPAAVLVPVAGGGLIAGVAAALRARSPGTVVIGVEPALAADAGDSFRRGELVGWPAAETGRTIADALRVERLGELPYAHIRAQVDAMIAVTDDEIRAAMRFLAHRARLVAEPGGAVAVAAYLFHRSELAGTRTGRHVAVVSGGNVDPELFAEVVGARPAPKP